MVSALIRYANGPGMTNLFAELPMIDGKTGSFLKTNAPDIAKDHILALHAPPNPKFPLRNHCRMRCAGNIAGLYSKYLIFEVLGR